MNVLIRELKTYRKSLLFWSIGMVLLIWASMVKYSAFSTADQSVNELMKQFPQSIQAMFGLTGFDLTTISGFFGAIFMYTALIATVHAVIIGSDIVTKEERDHTTEFLFVRPITRLKILSSKIIAGLIIVTILNIVAFLSSYYFADYYSTNGMPFKDIALLMIGLYFLQLIFYSIGIVTASVLKRPKLSGSIATSILLFTFILTVFININEKISNLKYLTPFRYFDARDILLSGKLDTVYVSISMIFIISMFVISFKKYSKRDLSV